MAGGSKKEPGALTKEIAAILRAQAARLGVSKAALAADLGISAPQMSKILAGQKQIDVEQVEDLSHLLNLNWLEVVSEASEAIAPRQGMN